MSPQRPSPTGGISRPLRDRDNPPPPLTASAASARLPLSVALLLAAHGLAPAQEDLPAPSGPAAHRLQGILEDLGEPRVHADAGEEDVARRRAADANYASMRREQGAGGWYAALLSKRPEDEFKPIARFGTRAEMSTFLQEHEAVVEAWTYAAGGLPSRRLTAGELSAQARSPHPPPTSLTVTFRDGAGGGARRATLVFGAGAAAVAAGEARRYRHHRLVRAEIRRALGARNPAGALAATSQWATLWDARGRGALPLATLPEAPVDDADLFVACECEVDADGLIARIARVYRASEVSHRIVGGDDGLLLRPGGTGEGVAAVAVRPGGEPGTPVPGRDVIEVRVRDEMEPDPARWNLLEFGGAWVLRESGLAQLALINAHLENQRRELAWTKSNHDRFAEPLFAGLNIGGGLAGVAWPLGETARLAYNVLLTKPLTPGVPTPPELRDLFRFVAAKAAHPTLREKPGRALTAAEVEELWQGGADLSAREVEDLLAGLSRDDLRAMLALPEWQNMDQKYRLYADILTDLLKVAEESESGILKDVFNNSRLSPSGELSLSTTLAVALGNKTVTPLSGVSLEQLGHGDGPTEAWLQFINLSVDVRAIANTLSLLRRRGAVDRELTRPFAHAPRLGDLAAYEVRFFGYPALFWNKRGLLKDDIDAFRSDFAYGISGTRVVERFPDQNDFLREARAGHLVPIGFARIPEGLRRAGRESNLPVFGYRIRAGGHAGETAIIVYGLKAFRSHAAFMAREWHRFRKYERILQEGGVIRKLVDAEDGDALPPSAYEPELWVGADTADRRFNPLLEDLLEYRRLQRFARWGIDLDPGDRSRRENLAAALRTRGVAVAPGGSDPLVKVDHHYSSFVYRAGVPGRLRRVQMVYIPSAQELDRGVANAEARQRREGLLQRARGGRDGP